ncbi:MAG: hypothetical protein DSM106950_00950 [Stigonema ocellatum SAG 48.90 = DSM 106950]|nr:hypothetical protein [Stigonema ocellatum SAG 48.90 = DSM 106950]
MGNREWGVGSWNYWLLLTPFLLQDYRSSYLLSTHSGRRARDVYFASLRFVKIKIGNLSTELHKFMAK